jgi:hypothetical protein
MTPQERQLVDGLFDRLAQLEASPRDGDAERLIADGARRAPHALYALVQTALVQDEALKRANARIEELQAQAGGTPQPEQRQGSFLDSLRAAFSPAEPHGSVPSVRAPAPAYQPQGMPPQPAYPPQMPGYGAAPGFGTGGSFLGTAASTAAGMIGGALLLDGIRSMFGGHHGLGANPSAFGDFAADRASPWAGTTSGNTSGSAADSDLARDAGIDHIGDHIGDAGNQPADTADDAFQQPADGDNDAFQPADGDNSDGLGGDGGGFSDDNSYDA